MRWLQKHSTKVLFILAVISVLIAFYTLQKPTYNGGGLWNGYTTTQMTLEGKTYTLVVAETPEHWEQGLMYVRKPVRGFDGMVFYFPEEQRLNFWNKNTFVDLTLYWLKNGEVVGTSELPSIEKSNGIVSVGSLEAVDTVVEIIK